MAILAIIFIGIAVLTIIKKPDIKDEAMLLIGIWGVAISAFLLPNMHERYLILADVLSIIYIIIYKRNIFMAIFINFMSLYLYYIYLVTEYLVRLPPILIAIAYLALVTYLTVEVVYRIISSNNCNFEKIKFYDKIQAYIKRRNK